MLENISIAGGASLPLLQKADEWWRKYAPLAGIDLKDYDSRASFENRVAWAKSLGLDIGTSASRFSTKIQHSTESQVEDNIRCAATKNIYIPGELLCVDEGVKGKRVRRDGFNRLKEILADRLADALVVFKMSRLLRVAYRSFAFVNEHIVENGLRAIAVGQGIDTMDAKTWKQLMYLHGLMDELIIDTIADHSRAALSSLFAQGFVTGALTVGYTGVEIEGARLTNLGRPRRKPVVDEEARNLIVEHFDLIRDGMSITEGLRRWIGAGGPYDPRSTTGQMSRPAYRRMLSNLRLTGRWEFGKLRNQWSSRLDYTTQILQPESEIHLINCEELRIVSDKQFHDVQAILAKHKRGPQGPRHNNQPMLCNMVTDCFYCASCSTEESLVRFYTRGGHGNAMGCKNLATCENYSVVRREDAVRAVCDSLKSHVVNNDSIIAEVANRAAELDQCDDSEIENKIAEMSKKVQLISRQISDLNELVGHGSEEDRAEVKSLVQKRRGERSAAKAQLAGLQEQATGAKATLTPEAAKRILANFSVLLEEGAAGNLGADAVLPAVSAFRLLTGECIMVDFHNRPARKQTNAVGTFEVNLHSAVRAVHGDSSEDEGDTAVKETVWLREPPQVDQMAPLVQKLIDEDGLSYEMAAEAMTNRGHEMAPSYAWQAYHRYYEMIGQPVPDLPYNNGHRRSAR